MKFRLGRIDEGCPGGHGEDERFLGAVLVVGAPDMAVDKFVKLLDVSHQLCAISLRHKLGITRGRAPRFVAEWPLKHEVGRQYWEEFGKLRAEEASGDAELEEFTVAMGGAFAARQKAQPAGI
ncbi:hypothetical protein [Streptomyces tubercidicus]|uniref:hypothetical protein n=1 Tax=Streptomyces tubercidicus TaxID=47759 RepID=UPI0036803D93